MKRFVFVPHFGEPVKLEATKALTVEQMQGLVGGYIEHVPCTYYGDVQKQMFVNEEGLLKHLPHNAFATLFAGKPIVGNAFIALDKVD